MEGIQTLDYDYQGGSSSGGQQPQQQQSEESLSSYLAPSSSTAPISTSGPLIVNRRRQEGNPVLKYVRNVRYEWGDIDPDFECGPTFAIVYISFKFRRIRENKTMVTKGSCYDLQRFCTHLQYHKSHPNYVYSRISGRGENNYKNKVLLAYCNVEEPRHVLRELNMMCYRQSWTLIVCYSVEEAAEYIENFKLTQSKDVTFTKKTDAAGQYVDDDRRKLFEMAVGVLTAARTVSKSDAQRVLFNFGTLENVCRANEAQLSLSPGLGPIKAKNLYAFLHSPFTT